MMGRRPAGDYDRLSESTASDLLSAARRTDPDAWDVLVERYSPLIAHWIRRSGVTGESALDILQAVLIQVAAYLPKFEKDGEPASFRRWLRAVTNSQIAEFQRRANRQPAAEGGSDALRRFFTVPAPSESDQSRLTHADRQFETLERLFDQVESEVSPVTWRAFWLTTVEHQVASEVANKLGLTANAVRLAKARVLRRIRELAEQRDEPSTDG